MIVVRPAVAGDAPGIRRVITQCYGTGFRDRRYYSDSALQDLIGSGDTLTLVALHADSESVVGTAAVDLYGGLSDARVADFGRLAVSPEYQSRGVGGVLMAERLARVATIASVGLVTVRIASADSLKIAEAHGFGLVGLFPLLLQRSEHVALLIKYFDSAFRESHARRSLIPEVAGLAQLALENCGLEQDIVIDESRRAYEGACCPDLTECSFERWRLMREVCDGDNARRARDGEPSLADAVGIPSGSGVKHFVATLGDSLVGGLAVEIDALNGFARIHELVGVDGAVRPMLNHIWGMCRDVFGCVQMTIDVVASATTMQQTLLELGFVPIAYVPALVRVGGRRCDVVKMTRVAEAAMSSMSERDAGCRPLVGVVLGMLSVQRQRAEADHAEAGRGDNERAI